jgi:hypothetical protein
MANRFTRTDNGDADRSAVTTAERPNDEGARPASVSRADRERRVGPDRARQRDEFGGFNWGSNFFGFLVVVGLAAILTGILSAAGTAIGLTEASTADAQANAETVGIVGGILLLLVLMVAYYCGGYVAGRMSRFDGARNGFGVWLIGLIVAVALGAAAALLGAQYNVLQNVNLPSIPVDGQSLTTGGLIATAAIVIGTILAAVIGGKTGERYHRKVDRAGYAD